MEWLLFYCLSNNSSSFIIGITPNWTNGNGITLRIYSTRTPYYSSAIISKWDRTPRQVLVQPVKRWVCVFFLCRTVRELNWLGEDRAQEQGRIRVSCLIRTFETHMGRLTLQIAAAFVHPVFNEFAFHRNPVWLVEEYWCEISIWWIVDCVLFFHSIKVQRRAS